ncbi:DUF5695 domain-containing protein [Bradyrhizobium sp. DASA03005]|uniref:DUF5695 domain-containing protein n=1 Tax=Bradyrhizobium sp. SPXBL-02 TaxID=3395912 RepID=UPI003F70FB4F
MYLAMHRIARDRPAIPTRQSARDYLVRAYGTALAMFTVPMRVVMWSAYHTGCTNECVIPELVSALTTAGLTREAATLEAHWARKVRAFVDPKADLFKSEYPFDSTAFESTQALARSALDDPVAMGVFEGGSACFRGASDRCKSVLPRLVGACLLLLGQRLSPHGGRRLYANLHGADGWLGAA